MERARRHHRLLSVLAFALLSLVVELAGRSLTHRVDLGRHVSSRGYAGADYYPFLLIAVKAAVALLLARLAWRFAKARATARAAHRLVSAVGVRPQRTAPRVRLGLSPRLWLASFALTAGIYLVQADAERLGGGSGLASPLWPWLHSSALPVFAVLSVLAALVWRAVAGWLADYESYAAETARFAESLGGASSPLRPARPSSDGRAPRRLHGLAFESRPPPVAA
jgi:hypothetical protein